MLRLDIGVGNIAAVKFEISYKRGCVGFRRQLRLP